MKKVILGVALMGLLSSSAVASLEYECWMYKDGKPYKMTYIVADSKSEAERKVAPKFEKIGVKGDYIKCK